MNAATLSRAARSGRAGSSTILAAAGLVAVCLTALVVLLAASSPATRHWFVLPLAACGLLTGTRALLWAAEDGDILDIRGAMAAFGLYFFCLAPLLQVWFDYWHPYMPVLPNVQSWIGAMALLNLLGVLLYAAAFRYCDRPAAPRYTWRLSPGRFWVVVAVGLVVTAGVQALVYIRFGGISGYLAAFDSSVGNSSNAFRGYGFVFAVSESFPILLAMAMAMWFRDPRRAQPMYLVLGVLAVFLVAQMLCGGLRGSRSQTAYAGFWALGMIHIYMRRISLKLVLCVFLPLFLVFMVAYGVYKWGGKEAVAAVLRGQPSRAAQRARGWEHIMFTDLSRTQVQAIVLQRTTDPRSDYQYAWGRTYVAGLLAAVPSALLPEGRLPTKRKEGTEALRGKNTFVQGESFASYVYGLSGEAMLNFGPLAVPLAFIVLGCLAGWIRGFQTGVSPDDGRLLLFPFLLLVCVVVLTGDSNNVSTFLVRRALVPAVVIAASCRFAPDARWQASLQSAATVGGTR